MRSNIITLIALSLCVPACTKADLKGDGKTASTASANQDPKAAAPETVDPPANVSTGPTDDGNASESVDPPANIAGAFLHCAVEVAPTASKFEALLGCRFSDNQGRRVPIGSVGTDPLFTYRPAPVPSIKVYPKILENDNRYDAVYLIYADSLANINLAVAETRVFVKMKDTAGADTAVSGLLKDISVNAEALPEPRQTDYNQVRDEVLTEAAANEPVPPVP